MKEEGPLTKSDTVALWHAIQWMELCLREGRRMGESDETLAPDLKRLKTAKRALRKVNELRRQGL